MPSLPLLASFSWVLIMIKYGSDVARMLMSVHPILGLLHHVEMLS
jgi:hypothetical protein